MGHLVYSQSLRLYVVSRLSNLKLGYSVAKPCGIGLISAALSFPIVVLRIQGGLWEGNTTIAFLVLIILLVFGQR